MGGMVARRNTPEGARKLMLHSRLYNIFVKNCRKKSKNPRFPNRIIRKIGENASVLSFDEGSFTVRGE